MLENLVVALTQALRDRSKVAAAQGKSLNEGETTKQMDENERIYQETEEFYQHFDDPVCFAPEHNTVYGPVKAQADPNYGDIPFGHPAELGLNCRQRQRLRQWCQRRDLPLETLRHPKSQTFRRPCLINFQ